MTRLPLLILALAILSAPLLIPMVTAQDALEKDPVVVDEKSEAIIEGALKYLASKQMPNGAWGLSGEERQHPIAITGYVLMAFQAAGHLPGEGEFGKNVTAGMNYLADSISEDGLYGDRNKGQYMYGHGIATIALAELYGETRSLPFKAKLDKAIKVIIAAQNPEGGWRYRPVARDADVSVTVLQVVALRAAKNGGIDVPQKTIDDAVRYVKSCYHPKTGGFCYQPNREPGFARTAAAIYSLQVCGLYDDEMVKRGSQYLLNNLNGRQDWFTYGHFYAAPAQYMIGGETWEKWYSHLRGVLVKQATKKWRRVSLGTHPRPGAPGRGSRVCDCRLHHDPRHALPLPSIVSTLISGGVSVLNR